MRHLIRIYSVCHSVFEFWLAALYAEVIVSKFKDGWDPFPKTLLEKDINNRMGKVPELYLLISSSFWQKKKKKLGIFLFLNKYIDSSY